MTLVLWLTRTMTVMECTVQAINDSMFLCSEVRVVYTHFLTKSFTRHSVGTSDIGDSAVVHIKRQVYHVTMRFIWLMLSWKPARYRLARDDYMCARE